MIDDGHLLIRVAATMPIITTPARFLSFKRWTFSFWDSIERFFYGSLYLISKKSFNGNLLSEQHSMAIYSKN